MKLRYELKLRFFYPFNLKSSIAVIVFLVFDFFCFLQVFSLDRASAFDKFYKPSVENSDRVQYMEVNICSTKDGKSLYTYT